MLRKWEKDIDLMEANTLLRDYLARNHGKKSHINIIDGNIANINDEEIKKLIEIVIWKIVNDDSIHKYIVGEAFDVYEMVCKCFRGAYIFTADVVKKIDLIKKHEVLLVKLIEEKQFELCWSEIRFLYSVISNMMCSEQDLATYHECETISVLRGITFNATYLECLEEQLRQEIINATIAFHFLSFQCTLHIIAQKLKHNEMDEVYGNVFWVFPELLLSTGNFLQWTGYAKMYNLNFKKHIDNVLKIIYGMNKLAVVNRKRSCHQGSDLHRLCVLKLEIKAREFESYKGVTTSFSAVKVNYEDVASLTPYIEDLKKVLSDHEISLDQVLKFQESYKFNRSNQMVPNELLDCMLIKMETFNESDVSDMASIFRHNLQGFSSFIMKKEFLNIMKSLVSNKRKMSTHKAQLIQDIGIILMRGLEKKRSIYKDHISILDEIILWLKNSFENDDSREVMFPYVPSICKSLATIFKSHKQLGRLRSISDIAFFYGLKYKTILFACLELSICLEEYLLEMAIESELAPHYYSYKRKIERCMESCFEMNQIEFLAKHIFHVFELWYSVTVNKSHCVFDMLHMLDLDNFINALAHIIHLKRNLLETYFGNDASLNSDLKCILLVFLLELQDQTYPIYSLLNSLELKTIFNDELHQTLTYYYKCKNYIKNDLCRFKSFDISVTGPEAALLMAGASLHYLVHIKWDVGILRFIFDMFQYWVPFYSSENDEHQGFLIKEIINFAISFFMMNNLNGNIFYLANILKIGSGFTNTNVHKEIEVQMLLALCVSYLRMEFSSEVPNALAKSAAILKSSDGLEDISEDIVLKWKLLQLEFCLSQKNRLQAVEKYESILHFLMKNEAYNMKSGQSVSSLRKKYEILLTLAKFSFLTGKLNLMLSNSAESLSSVKTSVKILYSIDRKLEGEFNSNLEVIKMETKSLLMNAYDLAVNICIHFGATKDVTFFMENYFKLNSSITMPLLKSYHTLKLCEHFFILGDKYRMVDLYNQSLVMGSSIGLKCLNIDFLMAKINILTSHDKDEGNGKTSFANSELFQQFSIQFNGFDLQYYEAKVLDLSNNNSILIQNIDFNLEYFEVLYRESMARGNSEPILHKPVFKESRESLLAILLQAKLGAETLLSGSDGNFSFAKASIVFPSVRSLDNEVYQSFDPEFTNSRETILNKLHQVKELVLQIFQHNGMEYLNNHEFRDVVYILNLCLSIGSLFSYVDTESSASILDKECTVTENLFFLQDFCRHRPIRFEEELINDALHSLASNNELLPSCRTSHVAEHLDSKIRSFQQDLKTLLPKPWKVICIDICPYTGGLIIARHCYNRKPQYLKLGSSKFEHGRSFLSVLTNLDEIIKKSDLSTKAETISKVKTKEHRKDWWRLRFKLDIELQELLTDVEDNWLGCFRGIFEDRCLSQAQLDSFQRDFERLLSEFLPSRKECKKNRHKSLLLDEALLELFVFSGSFFIEANTGRELHINYAEENFYLKQICQFISRILHLHGEIYSLNEEQELEFRTCMKKLIVRHYQVLRKKDLFTSKSAENHIILILDGQLNKFPWESLSCLEKKSVSRMPSVSSLITHLKNNRSLTISENEIKETYYLVNPDGDLKKTENKFGEIFASKEGWDGYIGKAPPETGLISDLIKRRLFIYLGHGACEHHFRISSLTKASSLSRSLPPALLIGCSSASLSYHQWLEPCGTILTWLSYGSPMVLANLWDVTDKDIDSFSSSVFDRWGLIKLSSATSNETISRAVANSRKGCNLKFLNGSAPVVYGLPLSIE